MAKRRQAVACGESSLRYTTPLTKIGNAAEQATELLYEVRNIGIDIGVHRRDIGGRRIMRHPKEGEFPGVAENINATASA